MPLPSVLLSLWSLLFFYGPITLLAANRRYPNRSSPQARRGTNNTGLRGWMYAKQSVTYRALQISISQVEKGSPADGTITMGDVIFGVGAKPLNYGSGTEFSKALTAAEAADDYLRLALLRSGKAEEILAKLPAPGQQQHHRAVRLPGKTTREKILVKAASKAKLRASDNSG